MNKEYGMPNETLQSTEKSASNILNLTSRLSEFSSYQRVIMSSGPNYQKIIVEGRDNTKANLVKIRKEIVTVKKTTWVGSIYFWGNFASKVVNCPTPGPALAYAAPYVGEWLENNTGVPYLGTVTRYAMHGIGFVADPFGYSLSVGANVVTGIVTNVALDIVGVENQELRALAALATNAVVAEVARPENIQAAKAQIKSHVPEKIIVKIDDCSTQLDSFMHKQGVQVGELIDKHMPAEKQKIIKAVDGVQKTATKGYESVCDLHQEIKDKANQVLDIPCIEKALSATDAAKRKIASHTPAPIRKKIDLFAQCMNRNFQYKSVGDICQRGILEVKQDELALLCFTSAVSAGTGFFYGIASYYKDFKQAQVNQKTNAAKATNSLPIFTVNTSSSLFKLSTVKYDDLNSFTGLSHLRVEVPPLEIEDANSQLLLQK